MKTSSAARELRQIRAFPQLIKYLRDEMGWPIESDDFDDIAFEYDPDELGIDAKNAAKFEEIRRLRPMTTGQPWGIFFIKFAPGPLPVVALRRILGQLVVKKRASANRADRTAWEVDDLLFVSNYGESGSGRKITFAHFSQDPKKSDLPTLKVLGWDDLDTALHMDAVAHELTSQLAWPDDVANTEAWRSQWRAAFTVGHREPITTAKALSIRLAILARRIRDRIKTALDIETNRGPLTQLMKAFQTALVHNLDKDGFADMYAQTIAYGLLSARIADPHKKTADDFAAHMRTNPFLRELMETFLVVGGRRGRVGGPGIDFDELGVSEVVELLDDANMEAVVRDFGDRNPQEDPVIHFYEDFVKEYDRALWKGRGVIYTPRPVVSYIVRSVDELLRTKFGLTDGLADTATWGQMVVRNSQLQIPADVSPEQDFVQILDPATGTGTFLVEIIEVIHKTLVAKWKEQGCNKKQIDALWNEYVPRHLLTRLHGYELLMAPYAIAHLKVGLKLHETGYHFGSDVRARVYLTNALEPAQDFSGTFEFAIPALAHEARAVNEIKQRQQFTVVVGNPPYSNFGQLNKIPFILNLLEEYKRGLNERKLNLDDDFIKFVRFSQHILDKVGLGVLGMITNNVFFDGITHRRMRESIKESFSDIRVLDLHGSVKKREETPLGERDVNVFDIQQGVGISLFVRKVDNDESSVGHAELWGERASKYDVLARSVSSSTEWRTVESAPPHHFLVPKDFSLASEYERAPALTEMFLDQNSGIQTKNDGFVYAMTRAAVEERIADLRTERVERIARKYELSLKGHWDIQAAKEDIRENKGVFVQVLYKPFDKRWTYYTAKSSGFMARPRAPVMRCGLVPNRILLTVRNPRRGNTDSFFVADTIVDKDGVSPFDNATVFPLYLPCADDGQYALISENKLNLSDGFLARLRAAFGLRASGKGLPGGLTPEDIFNYAYAVFHSPGYRHRYTEFLKIDFPRLPLTGSLELFRALATHGDELASLHLLLSPTLARSTTQFIGNRRCVIDKVSWSGNVVWIDTAKSTGFEGVSEAVWNFCIGGYQVCERWLRDRADRSLSQDDITHYQKIVVSLSETIRLMKEIDGVIEQYGGWPNAFLTSEASAARASVIQVHPRRVKPTPVERYTNCVPLVPLKAAAGAFGDPQQVDEAEFEWVLVNSRHHLHQGMFVAQVVGKSMEPVIPDGTYCLFRAPVRGTRHGKTVLVQLRDARDPETGQRYTVKRYESEKSSKGDSWVHERITLKPLNSAFRPIVLTDAAEGELQVIAEFVEVLQQAE